TPGARERTARVLRGGGHRPGDRARSSGEDLRAALHHQGARDRSWPGGLAHAGARQWRRSDRGKQSGPGRHVSARARKGSSRMKRALIVDDDRLMVRTLSDVLRLKGWEVQTAYNGAEALNAVHVGFDVVLMDIKMPGMDGVAAFKAMKALMPGVRVILMTAYAAQELVGEAEREGVMRVLPKPVDVAALLELISARVHTRRPVLIVDDDLAFLKTLSAVLSARGFPTEVASTLDEAGRMIEARKPAA